MPNKVDDPMPDNVESDTHLAQVLKAVAEEVGLRFQKPVRGVQASVLLDHPGKNGWRISTLAHDPAVQGCALHR